MSISVFTLTDNQVQNVKTRHRDHGKHRERLGKIIYWQSLSLVNFHYTCKNIIGG
jgi:hypothetical protein